MSGLSLNPRHGSYERAYSRTMTLGGAGLSEAIELQEIADHDSGEAAHED